VSDEFRSSAAIPPDVVEHLRRADPVMQGLVDRAGPLDHSVDRNLWRALVGSIVGQQLSLAAARTIRARIAALGPNGFPDPVLILSTSDETLRACGLSRAKVIYLRDLASAWSSGAIEPAGILALPDEEVISLLTKVRGVGRWTAEMVLIFSLGRPDVMAVDDLGLRAAMQRAYHLPDRPGKDAVLRIAEPWRPYRSFASLYLWNSLKS
jgi:DNA-3-methyladenine glycosylase II